MKDTIKVQMFGNFRMDYNGSPLVAEKMHRESQFNRLMQVMMHYSDSGIPKDKLEELVIGERDIDAPHTALRVIVYKTKQKLIQLGLPGKDLIYLDGGMYYWTKDIAVEEDAGEFEKCFEEIEKLKASEDAEDSEDKILELYLKAFYLYKGEFLASYTGETWIAQEAKRYHQMFVQCVENAADILRRQKNWKELEKLGIYATKVDPLNEWEVLTMEALVETRRYDEATELYSKVVDYYLRECGIYPSSRLMEILEKYSNQMNHTYEILENIQEDMQEEPSEDIEGYGFKEAESDYSPEEDDDRKEDRKDDRKKAGSRKKKGGYFCSYPVFRGIYQTAARMMERNKVPVYLMLCTLVDKDGKQIQSENEMNKYSRQLKECIGGTIRRSDVYAKYGKIQFLVLLTGITRENCELVQERINQSFKRNQPRAWVKYHVNSVICEL